MNNVLLILRAIRVTYSIILYITCCLACLMPFMLLFFVYDDRWVFRDPTMPAWTKLFSVLARWLDDFEEVVNHRIVNL